MTNGPPFAPPSLPADESTPDLYADGMAIMGGPTGFALLFTLMKGSPAAPETVGVVRVSPHQLAVMAQALTAAVQNFEANVGPLRLPPNVAPKTGPGDG